MYGRHYIGFIDFNCLETEVGPAEAGAHSAAWDLEVQCASLDRHN